MPHSGPSDQNRGKALLPDPVAQHARRRDAPLIPGERNLVFREMSAKIA